MKKILSLKVNKCAIPKKKKIHLFEYILGCKNSFRKVTALTVSRLCSIQQMHTYQWSVVYIQSHGNGWHFKNIILKGRKSDGNRVHI